MNEAVQHRVSRLWFAAPIVWFGGYYLAAFESLRMSNTLIQEVRRENATLPMLFSVATDKLLLEPTNPSVMENAALHLVQLNFLPSVYVKGQYNRDHDLVYRAGDKNVCTALQNSKITNELYIHYGTAEHCTYSSPGQPEGSVFTASEAKRSGNFLLEYQLEGLRITDPSGRSIVTLSGIVKRLSWIPIPYLNCKLFSGCKPDFVRTFEPISDPDTTSKVEFMIVRALNLKRINPKN